MQKSDFQEILQESWSNARDFYAPLGVDEFAFEQLIARAPHAIADAVFIISWQGKSIPFVGEIKPSATPRVMAQTVEQIQNYTRQTASADRPALLVPYLSSGIVAQLKNTDVSAFDLNGNYYVQTPELAAVRLDQPNRYPISRDIKKIYTYNSSIVGRFLLRENRRFEQVNEIDEGIQELGGGISLSTVSKVLKGLADDILIEKRRGCIRVLQPSDLLQRLIDGYRPPRIRAEWKLKLPDDFSAQREILGEAQGPEGWIWSGETSAPAYASTTSPQVRTAFIPRRLSSASALKEFENKRFYNVVLKQTDDAYVYFDRNDFLASPVESCLALSQLDKRERQVAREIAASILKKFDGNY